MAIHTPRAHRGHKRSAPSEPFPSNSRPRYTGAHTPNHDARRQTFSSGQLNGGTPAPRGFNANLTSRSGPYGFQSAQQNQRTRILAHPDEVTNAPNAPTRQAPRPQQIAGTNEETRAVNQSDEVPDPVCLMQFPSSLSRTLPLLSSVVSTARDWWNSNMDFRSSFEAGRQLSYCTLQGSQLRDSVPTLSSNLTQC